MLKSEAPAVQKSVRVDAGKEACEVLIVDLWGRYGIKSVFLSSLMRSKTSPFAKLCGKALGKS